MSFRLQVVIANNGLLAATHIQICLLLRPLMLSCRLLIWLAKTLHLLGASDCAVCCQVASLVCIVVRCGRGVSSLLQDDPARSLSGTLHQFLARRLRQKSCLNIVRSLLKEVENWDVFVFEMDTPFNWVNILVWGDKVVVCINIVHLINRWELFFRAPMTVQVRLLVF